MSAVIVGGAICYRAGFEVDGDGSPHAYAAQPQLAFRASLGLPLIEPLDFLANAGHDGNWWGLACDNSGAPYIQGADDPAPGFYVSTTALVDHAYPARDPRRYVNSEMQCYVSVPRDLLSRGVHMSDLAWVIYGTAECGAVVGDVGPVGHYGEGSIALARELGIPPSPRNGGVSHPTVSYVVFPGSGSGWPRVALEVQDQARQAYLDWGGPVRLALALG
jgi:hypothetical protein